MNNHFTLKASLIVAAMLLLPVTQAAALSKDDYNTGKTRVSADFKADKAACAKLADNAKDVCIEEAKAKEKVALAEMKYDYSGKPADQTKLQKVKAEAAYSVAKEKCDDQKGNAKDVCVKEAKAVQTKALVDAKMSKSMTDTKKDGAQDKRDADYKVAVEKCDAMSGDAKASCVTAAKAKFKM